MSRDGADPLDALFAAPLTDFVATRKRLAADLMKGGDKQGASALKEVGKPSVSAWAVNQAVRRAPKEVEELVAASEELVKAQLAGGGPEQRARYQAAVAEQRRAVDQLVDRAAAVLTETGHPPNPGLRERIAGNLRWGALDQQLRPALVAGRLVTDIPPQDFGALLQRAGDDRPGGKLLHLPTSRLPGAGSAPAGGRGSARASPAAAEPSAADRRRAEQARKQYKLRQDELSAALQAARAATRGLQKQEERAQADVERRRREVEALTASLDKARAELAAAERSADRVRAERETAEATQRAADEAVEAHERHGEGEDKTGETRRRSGRRRPRVRRPPASPVPPPCGLKARTTSG